MKNIRLVINNDAQKKEREKFFVKKELQCILNLYAKMVSNGSWKDYSFSSGVREVSFDVYQRASDKPVLRILKNLKPIYYNEKYIIKDNLIEVHDFDFDQISYIYINDQDSHILSLLKNGINTNNVKKISGNTFVIDNMNKSLQVEFKSEEEFIISYEDNMNFRNTINFKSINKQ